MVITASGPTLPELLSLYGSVGWTSYTADPGMLERAVQQSSHVLCARSGTGELIGLIRAVSDDVSICYIQDLLVRPEHHRQGVGRALMVQLLDRYAHVMQRVLLTDNGEAQHAFYSSLGFHDTRTLVQLPTTCFYQDTRHPLG
ncbi:GNAT family N-acetyltransferase [Deinococcus sonorensis]|uniref:GNAT family N-acetyltransferase n=2 Tax=Deinococcus sonorensis TaxID=309891 RepID=A0AAU7U9F6_9DEIO